MDTSSLLLRIMSDTDIEDKSENGALILNSLLALIEHDNERLGYIDVPTNKIDDITDIKATLVSNILIALYYPYPCSINGLGEVQGFYLAEITGKKDAHFIFPVKENRIYELRVMLNKIRLLIFLAQKNKQHYIDFTINGLVKPEDFKQAIEIEFPGSTDNVEFKSLSTIDEVASFIEECGDKIVNVVDLTDGEVQ